MGFTLFFLYRFFQLCLFYNETKKKYNHFPLCLLAWNINFGNTVLILISGTTNRGFIFRPLFHNWQIEGEKDLYLYRHPLGDPMVPKISGSALARTVAAMQNKFTGFFFVRDPFQRALSAYFDKIRKRNDNINSFFRSLVGGYFDWNVHFTDFFSLCDSCRTKFDFIGRRETHDRDLDYIINNITSLGSKLSYTANQKPSMQEFFRNRSKKESNVVARLEMSLVYEFIIKFKNDYLAYGYNPYDAIHLVRKLKKKHMNKFKLKL